MRRFDNNLVRFIVGEREYDQLRLFVCFGLGRKGENTKVTDMGVIKKMDFFFGSLEDGIIWRKDKNGLWMELSMRICSLLLTICTMAK